jgi:indolepyruvate ferredoxin oxidoreductase beta subunit
MVGVGGQGIIWASDILSEVALQSNYDVKKNEIHGMSQRGGAVVSHIRFGNKVYSPIISEGSADFIVSFEKMEFLRYIEYINEKTILLLNTQVIYPLTVTSGKEEYPNDLITKGIERFTKSYQFNALDIAIALGNPRVVSSIILGGLSTLLPFNKETWENIIRDNAPKKTIDLNIKAFMNGNELVKNSL